MEIRFESEFLDRHMVMIAKRQRVFSNGHISSGTLSKLFLFSCCLLHSCCIFQNFILLLITKKSHLFQSGCSQHISYSSSDLSLPLFYLGDFILVTSVEFEDECQGRELSLY